MIVRIPIASSSYATSCYRTFHSSIKLHSASLRDENIKARYVRVVDSETGSLSPDAKRTQRLLRELDRTKYWLVQVKGGKLDAIEKAANAGGSGKGKAASRQIGPNERGDEARQREEMEAVMPLEDLAIVKLVDKKEAYNREKERKLGKKEGKKISIGGSASAHKEADVSWSSTSHDIEHKLKQLRNHLKRKGPGARCTINIKPKAQQGHDGGLTDAEKKELIQRLVELVCDWKEAEDQNEEDNDSAETPAFHARQAGQTQWRDKNKRVILAFEVVKGPRPLA